MIRYFMIYLLAAIGLTPGVSSTVHIYTQTINRTKQNNQYIEQHKSCEGCGPCPVFASYTLAFALQLRRSTVRPQSWYRMSASWHDKNRIYRTEHT
jgi:hypothetical protein